MIHVRVSRGESSDQDTLHISLVSRETIKDFYAILNRSLNCLPPEQHKDWVSLSDGMERFLEISQLGRPHSER